jgi:hypothetical protein
MKLDQACLMQEGFIAKHLFKHIFWGSHYSISNCITDDKRGSMFLNCPAHFQINMPWPHIIVLTIVFFFLA